MRGRRWFLTIALLLHLPLFVYPIVRVGDWLDLPGWLTLLVLLPLVHQYLSRFVLTNKKAIGAGSTGRLRVSGWVSVRCC